MHDDSNNLSIYGSGRYHCARENGQKIAIEGHDNDGGEHERRRARTRRRRTATERHCRRRQVVFFGVLLAALAYSSSNITANAHDPSLSRAIFRGKQRFGRIKVRLTHKVFQRQRDGEFLPKSDSDVESISSIPLHSTQHAKVEDNNRFDWRSFFKALVPRGLMLVGLAALAVLEPSQQVSSLAMSSSKPTLMSLPSRYSFQWSKLAASLSPLQSDGKSLATSLLSSMVIVWVPTLLVNGAWAELTLLGLSFLSNSHARGYFRLELWPNMIKTAQKLLWGEIWKHTWDFVLHPFPSNLLVPKKEHHHHRHHIREGASHTTTTSLTQTISGYASDFWHRLHIRVDKMTSMLLRKSIEGTVQSSLGTIAKDSWESILSPDQVFGSLVEGISENDGACLPLEITDGL